MVKRIFKFQDFNLKNDPLSQRFFICSAFEIFYKCEKADNLISSFSFLNIGSLFITELLDDLSNQLFSSPISNIENVIEDIRLKTSNHKYLTKLDKSRFNKFLNKLSLFLFGN